jgi:hypothetical protein
MMKSRILAVYMHDLLIRNDGHKCSKMGNRAEKKIIRREGNKEGGGEPGAWEALGEAAGF